MYKPYLHTLVIFSMFFTMNLHAGKKHLEVEIQKKERREAKQRLSKHERDLVQSLGIAYFNNHGPRNPKKLTAQDTCKK